MVDINMTLVTLSILIILFVFYFLRKKDNNINTKLYSILLVLNIVYCLTNIVTFVVGNTLGVSLLLEILFKVQLVEFVLLIISLFVYEFHLLNFSEDLKKKITLGNGVVGVLLTLFIIFTGINVYFNNHDIVYGGLSYNIMFYSSLVYSILVAGVTGVFYLKKKNDYKNSIPFIIFILLYFSCLIFNKFIDYSGFIFAITSLITYFVIENLDRKRITQLEEEKDIALKANDSKTEFLTQISHDVRTPLNAIIGFTSSLEKAESLDKAKEHAKDIVSASNEILDIVNGLLDISKVEEHKVKVVNGEYSFVEECEEVFRFVEPRMELKNINFKHLFSREIPKVLYGDKNIVRDIVTNLLNNAIEYTKDGYIDFKAFCKNNDGVASLILIVEDSGVGISEENLDKIFDKYSKFDDESDDLNASGLELSLTKKLVELLGGRIVVKTASGAGTKFVVYLEQKIAYNQKALEEVKEEEILEESVLDLTGKKILIVDDNNLNLKVAVNFIKPYGAEITTCVSGSECISLIESGKVYDLIFMDYMMPNMSGAETLHALKKDPEFKQRVVVLTANNIEGFREKYIEAGFEDYIAKPIIKDELERVLKKYLNNNVQKVVYDDEKKD